MKNIKRKFIFLYLSGVIIAVIITDIYRNSVLTRAIRIHIESRQFITSSESRQGSSFSAGGRAFGIYSYKVNGLEYEKKSISTQEAIPLAYYSKIPNIAIRSKHNIDYYPYLIIYFTILIGLSIYIGLIKKRFPICEGIQYNIKIKNNLIRLLYVAIMIHAIAILPLIYSQQMGYFDKLFKGGIFSNTLINIVLILLVITVMYLLLYYRNKFIVTRDHIIHNNNLRRRIDYKKEIMKLEDDKIDNN